jgi:cobaltochelatase CobS
MNDGSKTSLNSKMPIDTIDKTFSDTKTLFGFDSEIKVPILMSDDQHIPAIDDAFIFDPDTTLSILAGFIHNRRVMLQGYPGTGKSTHIEQVAARMNWPCVRINLDGHVSRMDLIGKDAIVIENDQPITRFQPGMLTWALSQPCALILDEYDAGRPDVMFVLQRLLEADGKLTLLDQSKVLTPHRQFRIFATANTLGLGDSSGLYHGTQALNQAQLDRWNIVAPLNYLSPEQEQKIVVAKVPEFASHPQYGAQMVKKMVMVAGLIRQGFVQGDLSCTISPRTLIFWAENSLLFSDLSRAFELSFLNKCDETERPVIREYYQRCFDIELSAHSTSTSTSTKPSKNNVSVSSGW